jgi:hypothetical protein
VIIRADGAKVHATKEKPYFLFDSDSEVINKQNVCFKKNHAIFATKPLISPTSHPQFLFSTQVYGQV